MNDKTSWDHSLVKKYSSSNHLKMLNQLRNEVVKYPLKKKKNISSSLYINTKNEIKNKEKTINSKDSSVSINSNVNEDIDLSKSTVSFNNSKDFSIYNNKSNNTTKEQMEYNLLDSNKSSDEVSSLTFKDRLNQIDMK